MKLRHATQISAAICFAVVNTACIQQGDGDLAQAIGEYLSLDAPAGIPDALQRVIDDPNAYSDVDNPLVATTPGTVVDDLDALETGAGRITTRTTPPAPK